MRLLVLAAVLAFAACVDDAVADRAAIHFTCTDREAGEVVELDNDADAGPAARAECVGGLWVIDLDGDGLRDN